jgi:hypothetical protein
LAKDFSFDVVSEVDGQEIDNAVNQAIKEINTRYDLKTSGSQIDLDKSKLKFSITSNSDFTLKSVKDVIESKFIKRGISLKSINYGKVEPASGAKVRQEAEIQHGIPTEKAKEIVKIIKDSKIKVQTQIEGEKLRISGKVKDDLQRSQNLLKEKDIGLPLQFNNYR